MESGGKPCLRGLAFPHDQHFPAHLDERPPGVPVSSRVSRKLGSPIGQVGLGRPRIRAAMLVPKASVTENRLPAADKGDVRAAWEVGSMEAVPKAQLGEGFPNRQFRFRVLL